MRVNSAYATSSTPTAMTVRTPLTNLVIIPSLQTPPGVSWKAEEQARCQCGFADSLSFLQQSCPHDTTGPSLKIEGVRVILRRDGLELLLIRQPDHAVLASQLMSHWRADGLPGSP